MMLASSRKILSYLLSAITAVVLVVAVISGINHLTIDNKNFYIKSFSTQALADECDKQLTEKYKTLSKKSNLPFDIFDSVKVKFDTKESLNQAAEFLFDENDATLKNGSRYNYFKSTIGEYIEANDIKISDKTIDIVASEASRFIRIPSEFIILNFCKTICKSKTQGQFILFQFVLLFWRLQLFFWRIFMIKRYSLCCTFQAELWQAVLQRFCHRL